MYNVGLMIRYANQEIEFSHLQFWGLGQLIAMLDDFHSLNIDFEFEIWFAE